MMELWNDGMVGLHICEEPEDVSSGEQKEPDDILFLRIVFTEPSRRTSFVILRKPSQPTSSRLPLDYARS